MKILIVDDHAFLRRGIKEILEDDGIASHIGEAGTGQEALTRLGEQDWDIVLLDLGLPDLRGVDILKQIVSNFPELAVLIVSVQPEEQYALRLIANGAQGYLSKDMAPEELIKAVHILSKGDRYISEKVAQLMAENLNSRGNEGNAPPQDPHHLLSNREYEVFLELAVGHGLTQIATALAVSVKTISTYRSRIMKKMAAKSNADLTIYATSHHLIDTL